MAGQVSFFGDGSLPLHPSFSQILQARSPRSLLSVFLHKARLAIQDEISRIPISDRKGMPDLPELERLIPHPSEKQPLDNQCLAPAMLVIIQLGQFISWHESHPEEPYPNTPSSFVVGLCVGQLSAVAVSISHSLNELLPLAIESVRLAFRSGLLATTVRDELELSDKSQTWAMQVPRATGLGEADALKTFHQEDGISARKRSYISASFGKGITIQGPPSTLDKLGNRLSADGSLTAPSSYQRLPIYTPYHAAHLYSDEDINHILNFSDTALSPYDKPFQLGTNPRLVSPVTGSYYSAKNGRDLLRMVLHDVLKAPIEWSNVVAGCVDHVSRLSNSDWNLRAYGPTLAAGSLVSALKRGAQVEAIFDGTFASTKPDQNGLTANEPIAIVGMAGRFPEATSHEELWKLLEAGVDTVKVIPSDRFDPEVYVTKDGNAKNPTGSPYGCFIKEPGLFDARFFNMSPREAEQTDPQQRFALTTAYEALEMSGFVPNRTPSTQLERIGTYYGQTGDDYREWNASQDVQTYYISGNDRAFGPGRINHHFKFGGPSMSIDTACSSSAVALNVACTALWANDCDTAVVGGMTLFTSADTFCGLSRGHFLNHTGNCKTFDDAADGYCRGEAIATVVIKRLSDAKADNDRVLAVILAAGTNYSAASTSITHPHGPTQEVLYRRLLNDAGLQPFDVDYVEMHGTGTQAGDAAEMSSVSNVFAPDSPRRSKETPLLLGAVKSNVGHSESASGLVALIKTLLVLREQKIPPHVGIKSGIINHTFPNLAERQIQIALNGPIEFPRRQHRKRRVMVNNFGAAGGNTAVLLEEASEPIHDGESDERPEHVIAVSAKTSKSAKQNVLNLLAYLREHPDTRLSDLSYTTTARRMHFPTRFAMTASSIAQLESRLSAVKDDDLKKKPKPAGVIFTFTGQGSLYAPLAKEFLETSQQFRSDIIRFNRICLDYGFPSFMPVLERTDGDLSGMTPTQTQLAITCVQISLYRLWAAWGIVPTAVIGHSLGEYAALFASGVLSANDTIFLVGQRAQLLEKQCTQGTHCMLSAQADIGTLKNQLGNIIDDTEIACLNGPADTVLSGRSEVLEKARERLKSSGIKCVILNTPFAFHSAQIDPVLKELEVIAGTVNYMTPKIPLLSPLLGTVVYGDGQIGPVYIRKHARESVNFVAALKSAETSALVNESTVWVEIGPKPICLGMVQKILGHTRMVHSLRPNESPWVSAAKGLSSLYNYGFDIHWNEYHRDFEQSQSLLHTPAYSFDEKNYWLPYKHDWALRKGDGTPTQPINRSIRDAPSVITTTLHTVVSKESRDFGVALTFETDLSEPILHKLITGHKIHGSALCPAGVYADMALSVADFVRKNYELNVPTTGINVTNMTILGSVTVALEHVPTPQLLRIGATANLERGTINIEFKAENPQTRKFTPVAKCAIEFGNEKTWLHDWSRSAYLVRKRMEELERGVGSGTTNKMLNKMAYHLFSQLVDYSPIYQGMQEVLVDTDELEASAVVKFRENMDIGNNFVVSPVWIDNLAQVAGFVMNGIGTTDLSSDVYISHGWGSLQLAGPFDSTRPFKVHVKMQSFDKTVLAGNVSVFQENVMIGLFGDVMFQKVPSSLLKTMLAPHLHVSATSKSTTTAAKISPAASTAALGSEAPPKRQHSQPNTRATPPAKKETEFTRVIKIVADEVGVDVGELQDDNAFSALGVDSLLSLTVLSKVRELIGIDLPQSTFADCETVGDLKAFLNDTSSQDAASESSLGTSPSTPPSSGQQSPRVDFDPVAADKTADMIEILHTTLAEQIGVDVDELLSVDDLSTLGVDSLMSLSIVAALREKLGIDVPSDMLAENSSLKGIKGALNLSPLPTLEPLAPVTKSHQSTPPVTITSKRTANSFLLQGNPKTASKTIFLFPDGSGSATSYRKLPDIAPSTCVYAIDSPFLRYPAEYTCSLEETALIMATEVQSRLPKGPYILAGWSAGGMYAYEAAKHLVSVGEVVSKLILIDSPCRLDYGPMPQDVLDYVCKSGVIAGEGKSTSAPDWLVQHFQGTIRAVKQYSPHPFPADSSPPTSVIWAARGVFEDFPGAEVAGLDLSDEVASWLLKPKSNPGANGWDKLLSSEKIQCCSVDGNHFSMVHPPFCSSLSRAIAGAIDEGLGIDWKSA